MWPFSNRNSGVSLHGEIDSYGSLEQRVEAALAGYRAAIDSVVGHTPRTSRGAADWRKNLRQVRARIEDHPSVGVLKETAKAVDRELANWGKLTEQSFEEQEKETKDAMAAVAVMAEVLGSQEKTHGVRFRGISKKLRLLTTSNDIVEIRKKMQSEIELLEQYVDEMGRENENALSRLRNMTTPAKAAPAVVPAPAPGGIDIVDAIKTGVRNEDRVAVVILTAPPHIEGSSVELLVERMVEVFESPGLTGQLEPGVFLAITRLPLPEAAVRLDIVERDLSMKLGVRLDSSVFEKTPGHTVEELFAKAGVKVKA